MTPMMSLVIDGVLALLLVAAIAVCALVYRKLRIIKEGQGELRGLVTQLNKAVGQAEKSVSDLKQNASNAELKLSSEITRAKTMSDELKMITEAGNNLADRIENRLVRSKDTDANKAKMDVGKKEQRELLSALREAR